MNAVRSATVHYCSWERCRRLAGSYMGRNAHVAIAWAVVGKNVELLDGPWLKGLRIGTLSINDAGLHFVSRIIFVPVYSWHIAWEDVAEIEIGNDVARRWSNFLPMKVAHAATHLTVHSISGDLQGLVVPNVSAERVHNLLRPSIPRWNQGSGVHG